MKMATVIAAMRRAILPMSLNRSIETRNMRATGISRTLFEDFRPARKSNPRKKTAIINKTAGTSFTVIV